MPRRVHWPCWHRPALRLVNQTLRPPPSWAPPAVRGTRSPAVGHLSPAWSSETTAPPWRTNPVSNPTTKSAGTVAETQSPAAATVIKLGLEYPAIMLPLVEIHPMVSSPTHLTLFHPALEPAAALHRDTLSSSSLTNRVSLLVDSSHHTARLRMERLRMSSAVPPARAAAIIIIPKKTLK